MYQHSSQVIARTILAALLVGACSLSLAAQGVRPSGSNQIGSKGKVAYGVNPALTTSVQSLDLHATFHNVGVQVNFTGDANRNAKASLEYSLNGGPFVAGHRLSRVGHKRFVGSVFDLTPQTQVTVRVTITDPEGVRNAVQVGSITTRSQVVPSSLGAEIHVALNGNDVSGNGSSASPFRTIQHAVDGAVPGSKVMIHAGTYREHVLLDTDPTGSPSAPLTITQAGDGPVILDGSEPALNDASAWTDMGNGIYRAPVQDTHYIGIDGRRLWRYDNYLQLRDLSYGTDGGFFVDTVADLVYLRLPGNSAPSGHTIEVSVLHNAFELTHTSDVVFDNLVFRNFNLGPHSASISVTDKSFRIWVVNSTFEQSETGVRLEGEAVDTVVMGNEFSDAGVTDLHWDIVKEFQWWLEHGALYVSNDEYSGYGTIFYNNYVHDYFDGVKIVGNELLEVPSNSDVINNTFIHLSDDGIETDGYSSNVRISGNRFENLLVGVSIAPALGGPTYIIRNLMVDLNNVAFTDYETSALKFNFDGDLSGEVFAYHNTASTFEAGQAGMSVTNSANWQLLTLKNNIWKGTQWGMFHYLDNAPPVDQNFDLVGSDTPLLIEYQGDDYTSLSAFTAISGRCADCLHTDPLFTNSVLGDYSLQAGSPAVDAAEIIPGINDFGFNGSAPDIGALER